MSKDFHFCRLIMPIHSKGGGQASAGISITNEINSLNLKVSCEDIHLLPSQVRCEFGWAGNEKILSTLNAALGRKEILYDDHVFQFIEERFDARSFAPDWLIFEAEFSISDAYDPALYEEPEDDPFSDLSYARGEGLVDGKSNGTSGILNFTAKEIYVERFKNLVFGLMVAQNICEPKSWFSDFVIISTTDWLDDEFYGLPNTESQLWHGISPYFEPAFAPDVSIPVFEPLCLSSVWPRLQTIKGFIDGEPSTEKIGTALNHFSGLFLRNQANVLHIVSAIESFFETPKRVEGVCDTCGHDLAASKPSIRQHLLRVIPAYIDLAHIALSNEDFKKTFDRLYARRSGRSHGSVGIYSPILDKKSQDDELAEMHGLTILLTALRKHFGDMVSSTERA